MGKLEINSVTAKELSGLLETLHPVAGKSGGRVFTDDTHKYSGKELRALMQAVQSREPQTPMLEELKGKLKHLKSDTAAVVNQAKSPKGKESTPSRGWMFTAALIAGTMLTGGIFLAAAGPRIAPPSTGLVSQKPLPCEPAHHWQERAINTAKNYLENNHSPPLQKKMEHILCALHANQDVVALYGILNHTQQSSDETWKLFGQYGYKIPSEQIDEMFCKSEKAKLMKELPMYGIIPVPDRLKALAALNQIKQPLPRKDGADPSVYKGLASQLKETQLRSDEVLDYLDQINETLKNDSFLDDEKSTALKDAMTLITRYEYSDELENAVKKIMCTLAEKHEGNTISTVIEAFQQVGDSNGSGKLWKVFGDFILESDKAYDTRHEDLKKYLCLGPQTT